MMHKFKFYSLAGWMMVFLMACDKSDSARPNDLEYIGFGTFYGYCIGETCIELFRLEADKLWENISDPYPQSGQPVTGEYVELSAAQFERVKDLISPPSAALLAVSDSVIGMPDYTDGGGVYLEYKSGTTHRFWLIDNWLMNVPEAHHELVGRIHEAVALINE